VVFCDSRSPGYVSFLALGAVFLGATFVTAEDAFKSSSTVRTQETIGNPLTAWIIDQMVEEIRDGLKTRGIDQRFAAFQSYAGERLNSTAGLARTSEVTGNCRLSWYDHLMRNPLKIPFEAEQFTRELHKVLRGNAEGLDRALIIAREKMDAGERESQKLPEVDSPEKALDVVKQAITKTQTAYNAAFAPLSQGEIAQLRQNLYPVLTSQGCIGHTLLNRSMGRYLCDLLEKTDRSALFDAADALAPLNDPKLLDQLAKISDSDKDEAKTAGVGGAIVRIIDTPSGKIIVGGKEKNTYELDKTAGVCAVIDLGGDDLYREGSVSPQRPILIVLDLAGNDRYEGRRPGIQGGAMLGVSMLIDVAGNDVYDAKDIAQGSAVGGVGILIDFSGNDRYRGFRRAQGQALGGVGILLDRAGQDDYHAAMWAQGFGGPLGFGVLDDPEGDDHYYCGGMWLTSYYPETQGYECWGQGVGAGIRSVADGGIGVILDGGGDDAYEYDYFAQGGGYWLGMGFARDFGGNDRRFGSTQKEYDGSHRVQPIFDRFTCGFGCHYAIGFCLDDAGNDTYGGTIMGLGMAWDCSVGYLCDFGGNDRYEATGGLTEGDGAQAGLGVLLDYGGDDVYRGYNQGYASPGISYHQLPWCGGNFSFLIDYGGKDAYGCGFPNNNVSRRGSNGGFLIDRPLQEEIDAIKASESVKSEQVKKEP
jgi:hypothetical protein